MLLREVTEHDLPAVLALYIEAGIADASFTLEEACAHLQVLRQYPYFRVFVAVTGQTVVGTFELLIMDNLAKRGAKAGVLEAVAVHPGHQGKGIGRKMMAHALDQCRQQGCYKLTLSSNLKRTSAHSFYEGLGFERHGYSFQIPL